MAGQAEPANSSPWRRFGPLAVLPAAVVAVAWLVAAAAPAAAGIARRGWPALDAAAAMHGIGVAAAVLVVELATGFLVAGCLPRRGPAAATALAITALPLAVPAAVAHRWAAAASPEVWRWLAAAAGRAGLPLDGAAAPSWLGMVLADLWRFTPLAVILLHATWRGLPPELPRAAAADGASVWLRLRVVHLPAASGMVGAWLALRAVEAGTSWTLLQQAEVSAPAGAALLAGVVPWGLVALLAFWCWRRRGRERWRW